MLGFSNYLKCRYSVIFLRNATFRSHQRIIKSEKDENKISVSP